MAYLHDEKETVEMDFPLNIVWENIKKVVSGFEWTIETADESTWSMKAKTKEVCFLSYATVLSIEAKGVSEKVSRVTIRAETPVTTLLSINFGKPQAYMNSFLEALSIELNTKTKSKIDKLI